METESESHELHVTIGNILYDTISKNKGFSIVLDTACQSKKTRESMDFVGHDIPLFVSIDRKQEYHICDVDALAIDRRGEKPIASIAIEIEETAIGPDKVCGKVLATGLARYYMHKPTEPTPVEFRRNSILFIQILKRTDRMKVNGSLVIEKMAVLEMAIQKFVHASCTSVMAYHLLVGDKGDFAPTGDQRKKLVEILEKWIGSLT